MNKATLRIIVLLAFTLSYNLPVLAVKTNVNEVNDLFERHIENKSELMRDLQEQREGAVRDIETGKGLKHVEGINEAESKVRELESIREVDLESSGRQKRASEEYRFYDDNEIEPDYSKPGNIAHKQDCDEIVSQTSLAMKKLGKDLQTKLSALGIDCHQVKGTTTKDLTYHIEISGEEHKNSEYEQVICEEPRNKYNCHDALTLRCAKRGIRFGPWQSRQIVISGSELFRSGKTVFWVDHTGRSCFEYKLSVGPRTIGGFFSAPRNIPPNSYHVALMREFLVTKHPGSTLDNIGTEMSSWWSGGLFSVDGWYYGGRRLGHKDYGWRSYTVNYQYRDGYPVCEQWSEDWSETCILQ